MKLKYLEMAGADASHTPEATFDAKLTIFSEQRIPSENACMINVQNDSVIFKTRNAT